METKIILKSGMNTQRAGLGGSFAQVSSTVFFSTVSFTGNTAGLSVNSLAPGMYSIVFEETSGATFHVSFVKR